MVHVMMVPPSALAEAGAPPGIDRILNVDATVGPSVVGGVNSADDVSAVQALFAIYLGGETSPVTPLPQQTGTFDSATGYYIYRLQGAEQKSWPTSVVDGLVSPATDGEVSYGGGYFVIAALNFQAYDQDADAWNALVAQYENSGGGADPSTPSA